MPAPFSPKNVNTNPCEAQDWRESTPVPVQKKTGLLRFGNDNETHRPDNHLEHRSQTNPAQKSNRGTEFRTVKQCDDHGSEGKCGQQARTSQQQAYLASAR